MNSKDFIDQIYIALTADTAYSGYSPAVTVYKGPREITAGAKQYSVQIQPQSIQKNYENLDNPFSFSFTLNIVGIIVTNAEELIDGGISRKGLTAFVEDTLAALDTVLNEREATNKIDFEAATIDYSTWPYVSFTIPVTIKYK